MSVCVCVSVCLCVCVCVCLDSAAHYFEESLSAYRSVVGPEDATTLAVLDDYSRFLLQTGQQEVCLSVLVSFRYLLFIHTQAGKPITYLPPLVPQNTVKQIPMT